MRVAVVGAGPAGAALSLVLARAGVEVRLIDGATSFDRVFRGEGLLPLGLDALEQLRLGWSIDQVPGRTVESWRILIDGDEVLRIPEPVAEPWQSAFRVASPAALLERLVADADREPTFSFHPACGALTSSATPTAGAHPLISSTSWDHQLQLGVIMPRGGLWPRWPAPGRSRADRRGLPRRAG